MSRRREAREQEKQDFLEQNPDLIEFDTRIEPVNSSEFVPGSGAFFDFNAEISHGRGPAFPAQPEVILTNSPDLLVARYLDGPDFFLFGNTNTASMSEVTVFFPQQPDQYLTVSSAGFGVTGSGSPTEPGLQTIDNNELFGIAINESNPYFAGSLPSPTDEDEKGGTSLGIDFVGSGRGTVQIRFFDADTGEEFIQEVDFSGGGRRGSEGHFEAEMPGDGAFDVVGVTTTGSLEISVVGIDLGTNFESGFGASI